MALSELMTRTDAAVNGPRTLYLYGKGGWYGRVGAPPPAQPGETVAPASVLAQMEHNDPDKYQRYQYAAAQVGIDFGALPAKMPACDCSGFVTWALGLPRAPSPAAAHGWTNTTSIWGEAQSPGARFEWCTSAQEPRRAVEGALLVYPHVGNEIGHIGIVTAVDAVGNATEVVHCAPQNYLQPAAPGRRHAILRTKPGLLLDHPKAITVWCRDIER